MAESRSRLAAGADSSPLALVGLAVGRLVGGRLGRRRSAAVGLGSLAVGRWAVPREGWLVVEVTEGEMRDVRISAATFRRLKSKRSCCSVDEGEVASAAGSVPCLS